MIDLTGQKFGKLTVDKYVGKNKYRHSLWLCKCDCGNEKIFSGNNLRDGSTNSCGCLKLKHGYSRRGKELKIYRIWFNMMNRCNNQKNPAYRNYGGRGIKVCERWMKFENFLEDMGECPGKEYSLDRINNDLGYFKENCKWSTRKEQARNRRTNRILEYDNKKQPLIDFAEEYLINPETLKSRLNKDMSIKEALTIPVKQRI